MFQKSKLYSDIIVEFSIFLIDLSMDFDCWRCYNIYNKLL